MKKRKNKKEALEKNMINSINNEHAQKHIKNERCLLFYSCLLRNVKRKTKKELTKSRNCKNVRTEGKLSFYHFFGKRKRGRKTENLKHTQKK